MPKIPKAKKPGTMFNTVAPHVEALYKAPLVTAAVLTSVEIGPISETPTRTATNPPIKFAIIIHSTLLCETSKHPKYLNVGILIYTFQKLNL